MPFTVTIFHIFSMIGKISHGCHMKIFFRVVEDIFENIICIIYSCCIIILRFISAGKRQIGPVVRNAAVVFSMAAHEMKDYKMIAVSRYFFKERNEINISSFGMCSP